VHLPEQHTCQTGVLFWGTHHANQRRTKGVADDRPYWIIQAEKRLTKYPYSLLFSFLRLVIEPKPGDTLDDCVPPDKVLAWCTMYGLPDTEKSHNDERYGCLQLSTFQRETIILYLLFHLWKALIEWQDFEKVPGPSDPEAAEAHRGALHRYAELLLGLFSEGDRCLLRESINRECSLKQQLDRGIFIWVHPRRKQEFDLKIEYKEAKRLVDDAARMTIDEVVRQQMHLDRLASSAASKVIIAARSVFDACYLQLEQLMSKPPGEVAWHLKLCAEQSCGNLFWAPHGNKNFCEEHSSRGARWAATKRHRAKAETDHHLSVSS
jgi:hypothetical protein